MKDSGGAAVGGGSGTARVVEVSAPAITDISLPLKAIRLPKPPPGAIRTKAGEADQVQMKRWHTENMAWRIGADFTAAGCAAVGVAPLIATIDRGIIENASGKASLKDSILKSLKTLLLRPHAFIFSRPFALIFTVYSGTYMAANTVDTVASTIRSTPVTSTTHGTSKFAATSITNLSLGIWKDSQFTRLFGTTAPRPLPGPTYVLFMMRDSLTMLASFNLPPLLAPHVPMHLLPQLLKGVRSESIAQFVAPAAVQILSTPMHLLGLDLYNRSGISARERWGLVRRAWAASCLARIGRIVPAFGVGGVVNSSVRRSLMSKLQ